MQGFKPALSVAANNGGLSLIKEAFPNQSFPLGAVHEFFTSNVEDASASYGFISGILSSLMLNGGVSIWISKAPLIFPPALTQYGIDPSKIIFIHPKKDKDVLFVTEEALKSEGLSAVVADIKEMSFTESRRFQLATEQSNVTAFIVRNKPRNLSTASVTRWRIKPITCEQYQELPGISFPKWNVELTKVRNGKPGEWQMEWKSVGFALVKQSQIKIIEQLRKVV